MRHTHKGPCAHVNPSALGTEWSPRAGTSQDGYSRNRKVSVEVGCSDEMFDGSLVFADGSVYEAHVGEDL